MHADCLALVKLRYDDGGQSVRAYVRPIGELVHRSLQVCRQANGRELSGWSSLANPIPDP